MMILRTRKEQYLNEIVGNGNTAPGTPYTREELFFADILGEVNAPVPITRIEIYLAKIANKYSGELPEPKTRIEKFIARAAGMDVTIPTPITREEMFWADYALIVEKELNGIPPLTFKAKKAGTLKDYRIYGNTVGGESVGDLVESGEHAGEYKVAVKVEGKNLLPNTATSQTINGVTFTVNEDGSVTCNGTASDIVIYVISSKAFSLPVGRYELNGAPAEGGQNYNFKLDVRVSTNEYYSDTGNGGQFSILQGKPITLCRIVIYSGYTCNNLTFYPMIRKADIEDDTYEPYHAPVTTPIYLPEQIKMVGDEAEYVDYKEQKQHFADGTSIDVFLPTLPTLSGTNTLSVGTEVQPSNVYIKYEGAR